MSQSEVDFGAVRATEGATRELRIENRGDAPLAVQTLHSVCRCLTAEVSSATLPAGVAATLTLRYTARPYAGTEEADLLIRTSDPEARQTRLTTTAFVYLPVMMEPEVFHLRAARRGTRYLQPFRLYHWDRQPLVVSVSGELPPEVSLEWHPPESARPWVVSGTLVYEAPAEAAPKAMINETLEFRTNSPERPLVPLLLSGYVAGAFTAEPERIAFGVVEGATMVWRDFVLRCEPPHRLDTGRGVEITLDDPRLAVERIQAGSREATFRLLLRPTGRAEQLRTRLRIAPGAPDLPSLELPVRAILTP